MIKIICCLCIVTGSFLYGNMKAVELLKREKFLEGIISALTVIKQDIAYCKTPVRGLFEGLCRRKEYQELLIFNIGETEEGERISLLFEKNIRNLKTKLCISEDDVNLICEFISSVESADSDTALALCGRTTELLRQRAFAAHEKATTNGKLYRTLGLFIGIGAVLFFI